MSHHQASHHVEHRPAQHHAEQHHAQRHDSHHAHQPAPHHAEHHGDPHAQHHGDHHALAQGGDAAARRMAHHKIADEESHAPLGHAAQQKGHDDDAPAKDIAAAKAKLKQDVIKSTSRNQPNLRRLPPEDREAVVAGQADQVTKRLDNVYQEELRLLRHGKLRHLPPEDQEQLALERAQKRLIWNKDQANKVFLSQFGPTDYNSKGTIANNNEDCGPTSDLMALAALGLHARPDKDHAADEIADMRHKNFNAPNQKTAPEQSGTVRRGLKASGADAKQIDPAGKSTDEVMSSVNAAVDKGHPVIIGSSNTWKGWGDKEHQDGRYLNQNDPGEHFVVVLGKTPEGNYIVGDPLGTQGALVLTPAQVKDAVDGRFTLQDGGVTEVAPKG